MPEIQGVAFTWRPETGDGSPTLKDVEALQRSLTRADRGQVGYSLHPLIPLETWVGAGEVLIAAYLPGLIPSEIKVLLDGQELRIHAMPRDQSLTLPFDPDPSLVKVVYMEGILYIHAVRPKQTS